MLSTKYFALDISVPSGLVIADTINSKGEYLHICLLRYNSVELKPDYRRVKELKSVMSLKECSNIIQVAEAYAASNGGWTHTRHTNYPTTDIPVDTLLGEDNYLDELVNCTILPEFAAFFGLNQDFLHIGGS
jgi:hypothetical protein